MATVEHREPCKSRGSRTVLGAPGGEIPPGDSTEASVRRVNALCVISRAREAAAERGGNLAPAAERGAAFFCFGLSAVVRAAPAPAVSSTTSYRVGSSDRPIDRLVVWPLWTCSLWNFGGHRPLLSPTDLLLKGGRVNALCVISRAREAAAERGGNLAPAAERGAAFFCFGLSAVVRAAPAPAVSSTTSYRVGSSDRPIDRLVVWPLWTCSLWNFGGHRPLVSPTDSTAEGGPR